MKFRGRRALMNPAGSNSSHEEFKETSVEIVTVSGRALEDDSAQILTVAEDFSSSDDNIEGSDGEPEDYDEGLLQADWSNGNEDQPSGGAAGGSRSVGGLPPPTWRQNLPPSPPLVPTGPSQVVCVGEAVREFVPVVRRSSRQAPDEIFATWRNLQWVPPDFARAPGGPACQVAVALARLNADVAFVGAVGDDEAGQAFLEILDANGVSTRGVEMQAGLRTGEKLISLEKAQVQEKYEDPKAREELELREGEVIRGGVVIKKSGSGSSKNAGTAWRVGFPLAEEARDVAGQEEEEGEKEEEGKEPSEERGDGERRVKAAAAAGSGGGVSEDAQDVLRQCSSSLLVPLSRPSNRIPLLSSPPPLPFQASWVHCTSMSLATPSDRTALLAALDAAGCHPLASSTSSPPPSHSLTPSSPHSPHSSHSSPHSPSSSPRLFLDVNLPLCLWASRASALAALDPVWRRASVVEVSRAEAEFLVGEERFLRRRQARVRYASDSYLTLRGEREEGEGEGVYHWKPEELAGLWHEGMELLLVTHGTMQEGEGEGVYHWKPEELAGLWHEGMELLLVTRGTIQVHYYGRGFHGWVEGTEDVLIAAMTCDRAGSGDALVAGLLRKLSTNPSILRDPDALERAIRFAISAGVISSWTTGANERRERLVKASRDVTIQSKKIIFAIHRATTPRALAAAAQQLAALRAHHIAQVARDLNAEDYWRFTRAYTWGLQEYVEAASFLHFRQTGQLLSLAQVNGAFEGILDRDGRTFHVHAADYVLGVGGGGDERVERGKRPREQPEAQPEARAAESAGASEPASGAESAAEARDREGAVEVDADACRLFVQRLYAGFSLLPRSSEMGKEMGKKMDVMLASLNKIENVSYTRFVRGSEYPEEFLQLGLEGREGGAEGE
ncbi:unnamed protein product [Closterium sp. Yama58-4]|nr:unnamed protein product [Closterium sp. Yama58-4]